MKCNVISLEEASALLRYNPRTGLFFWKVKRNGTKAGKSAGCPSKYVRIKINGKSYSASCLAWLFMTGTWPENEVDHRDTNKHNNRWKNLRPATRAQNMQNCRKQLRAKSSRFKGVYWKKDAGRWEAIIGIAGKQRYLGRFDREEDAHTAYVTAAKKVFGEFARGA